MLIDTGTVQCQVLGLSANLLVPRCDEIQIFQNLQPGEVRPYEFYLDQHLEFIFRATQGAERLDTVQIFPKLRNRALTELKALEATIPSVTNGNTVLAMAAWFFLLCFVDDVVEKMPPMAAQATLHEGIQAIGRRRLLNRGTRKVSASSQAECGEEDITEAKVEGHQRVLYACKVFGYHVKELMRKQTYKEFLRSISEVFEGMAEEIEFRERKIPDVSLYLTIRIRTIGLSPFFILLADQCLSQVSGRDERLSVLETCVNVAIGMQNDLIGLDKDRKVGEWMNFAVLAAMDNISTADTGDGVLRCVETHNCAVRLALHSWNLMDAGTEVADRIYAAKLLHFVHLHFRWAVAAQRYR